jgi:hypothetical protein
MLFEAQAFNGSQAARRIVNHDSLRRAGRRFNHELSVGRGDEGSSIEFRHAERNYKEASVAELSDAQIAASS